MVQPDAWPNPRLQTPAAPALQARLSVHHMLPDAAAIPAAHDCHHLQTEKPRRLTFMPKKFAGLRYAHISTGRRPTNNCCQLPGNPINYAPTTVGQPQSCQMARCLKESPGRHTWATCKAALTLAHGTWVPSPIYPSNISYCAPSVRHPCTFNTNAPGCPSFSSMPTRGGGGALQSTSKGKMPRHLAVPSPGYSQTKKMVFWVTDIHCSK